MPTTPRLLVFLGLIMIASLLGGWLPVAIRLTHRRMEIAVSGVAGFMLGVGLLHLLPEALHLAPPNHVVLGLLAGFLAMFFIERFFCFHHHDAPADDPPETGAKRSGCGQQRLHEHDLTWSGAAVGLTLHSLIAGIALAAATHAETAAHPAGGRPWAGLAMFLVIVLHKPFDSLTLGALMAIGGWRVGTRHLVNALFALAVPCGALLFHFGVQAHGHDETGFLGAALAFATGTFLCIAMSDLLPELQFHSHDRVKLSLALLAGIALAWVVAQSHGEHDRPGATDVHVEHERHDGHGGHEHE